MKKALSLLLTFALTFSMCFGLISCGNANNPSDDNPSANNPNGDNLSQEPFSVDLAGYVANIGNATALGISKKAKASVSPMASYGTNNSGIQLLSYNTLASNKDTEDKNYIVMSTTDYDANAPEADKTGLTKVTFTKIVTENVTTETTGTKYIIANEGTISIAATEGFIYTVYYNDSLVYNEVQDNDSNDKDAKIGVIVLDNLIDGMEYKINYKGIGVETTITQDDINGEIDKLCVMNGYTFISFVPIGTSQRPSNSDNIEKDVNGYISYDKENYCSNNSRQSFVIDNDTGYVYPIKDVTIQKIHNNLLLINNLVYDYNIIDDNLNFFPLFTNTTIEIKDFMKDKYGNNYIVNDRINDFDESKKTLYVLHAPNSYYLLNESGTVVNFSYIFNSDDSTLDMKIGIYDENKKLVSLDNESDFAVNYKFTASVYGWCFSHVSNGYAYFYTYSHAGMGDCSFMRYNIEADTTDYKSYGMYDAHNEGGWDYNCMTAVCVGYNDVVFYTDLVSNIGELYKAKVWGDNGETDGYVSSGYTYPNTVQNLKDYINTSSNTKPQKLLSNCIRENWNNTSFGDWKLSVTTITSTNYYKIIVVDGEVCIVNEENYVAPAPQNYTLYPLNK